MTENLVIPKAEDWNRVIAAIGRPQHRSDPRRRVDDALIFLPGQPVPVTNNASTLAPKGGFAWCNGSAGSDADHCGIIQPLYPGIAQTLVIVDSDIPPGADGLAWTMDGCEHPIYDPGAICIPGLRIGAQAASWAPILFGLGPITVTAAAVNGLAKGICHGQQGDGIYVVDPAGVNSGFYDAVILGAEITMTAGSVPGDFSGMQ